MLASSAPLRAMVSSLASMTGTGPSVAFGTTGFPFGNLTWATAFPYALAQASCFAAGAAW